MGNDEAMKGALTTWPGRLVWVRAAQFVLSGETVPLVSSPNLLYPDRMAMEVLDKANRPYEIVFTSFDTSARRAAAEAGLGYFALPSIAVLEPLVIEKPGVLPDLPGVTMGIVAREDLDIEPLAPLIASMHAVLTSDNSE
jgi:DNA-binding transcriptional LysR family regulator